MKANRSVVFIVLRVDQQVLVSEGANYNLHYSSIVTVVSDNLVACSQALLHAGGVVHVIKG